MLETEKVSILKWSRSSFRWNPIAFSLICCRHPWQSRWDKDLWGGGVISFIHTMIWCCVVGMLGRHAESCVHRVAQSCKANEWLGELIWYNNLISLLSVMVWTASARYYLIVYFSLLLSIYSINVHEGVNIPGDRSNWPPWRYNVLLWCGWFFCIKHHSSLWPNSTFYFLLPKITIAIQPWGTTAINPQVGFTSMSSAMETPVLFDFLNQMWSIYEAIADEFGVYKVRSSRDVCCIVGPLTRFCRLK